jgi:L-2-hydroxycarboxylate dehydrogenase (NAD+)
VSSFTVDCLRKMQGKLLRRWSLQTHGGIETHGVARLRSYYETLVCGLANPRPKIQVIRQLPACAALDGDNGLGLIVGPKANQIAMEKAEMVGIGWVSVCHTNHFGGAGYYPWGAFDSI